MGRLELPRSFDHLILNEARATISPHGHHQDNSFDDKFQQRYRQRMAINVLDHSFINHKSSEMICWGCGYVIWRCDDEQEVLNAMVQIGGTKRRCGKAWHVTIPVNDLKDIK